MLFTKAKKAKQRQKARARKSSARNLQLEHLDKRVLLSVSTELVDIADFADDHFEMAGAQQAAFSSEPQVLYLDFDGAIVYNNYPDDFHLGKVYERVSSFSLDVYGYGGRESEAIEYILSYVKEDYAAYNVIVTAEEPDSGEYSTVYVDDIYGYYASGTLGMSKYDPGNQNPSNYAFVFTGNMSDFAEASNGDLEFFSECIANVISHEAGHSFGLQHPSVEGYTEVAGDLMNSGSFWATVDDYQASFRASNEVLLAENLGYKSVGGDDWGDGIGDARASQASEVIIGVLEKRSDTDSFRFTAGGTGNMTIDLDTAYYGNLDGVLSVYDTSGNLIVSNDNYNGGIDPQLTLDVVDGSEYVVVVSSSNANTSGSYTLTLDGPASGGQPDPDPALIAVSDSVDTPDDLAMDMGTVTVGENLVKTFTVTNDGEQDLILSSLVANGDFVVAAADGSSGTITLTSGQSKIFNVTYTPDVAEADSGSIVISSNSGGSNTTTTINLDGQGKLAPGLISVTDSVGTADDLKMDMGSVEVGDQVIKTFTITNTGVDDLVVSDIAVPGEFLVQAIGGSSDQYILTSGQSKMFNLVYRPEDAGVDDKTINITSNSGGVNTVTQLNVLGNGQLPAPVIIVSDSVGATDDLRMDMGTVVLGNSIVKTFTITNSGSADLVISNVAANGEFSVDAGAATLVGGASKVYTVRYTPGDAGADENQIVISSNSGGVNTSTVIDLTATGELPESVIAVADNSGVADDLAIDFGTVTIGEYVTRTFTITNDGGKDLVISNVAANGEFSVDGGAATLVGGASKVYTVRYTPNDAGADESQIVISSNSGGVNTSTVIDLTATGELPGSVIAVADNSGLADDLAIDFGSRDHR